MTLSLSYAISQEVGSYQNTRNPTKSGNHEILARPKHLDIPVLDANVQHIPASPAIIQQSQENAQEPVQVEGSRTRDMKIDVFLSKLI